MLEILPLLRIPGYRSVGKLLLIAALSIVAAGFEMIGMLVAVRIFETLVRAGTSPVELIVGSTSVRDATLIGMSAMAASAAAQVQVGRSTARLSSDYLSNLRRQLILAYRYASTKSDSQQPEGHIQELVSSVSYQASLLPMRFATMLTAAIATGVLVVIAFVIEPVAAAVLMAAGAGLALMLRPVSRISGLHVRRHTELQSELGRRIATWSARQREFRSFGVEDLVVQQHAKAVEETSDELRRVRAITHAGVALYRTLTVALLIVLVAAASSTNAIDPIDATLVLVVTLRALSYSQQFNSARQIALESIGPAKTVIDEIEALEGLRSPDGRLEPKEFEQITFEDAELGHFENETVLHHLDLTISSGDVVGIVGPSGGGKSTLARAIAVLDEPTAGKMTINGAPAHDVAIASWARLCAFMPQSPMLIPGTVADNVRFYRDDLPGEAVDAALARVGLADSLPATQPVEPGASHGGLSGGQIQRVALARALAGAPRMLVLDEPTSALDAESERLITDVLRGITWDITMIVVTHRPAPLGVCSRFIAVDKGTARELPSFAAAADFGRRPGSAAGDPS